MYCNMMIEQPMRAVLMTFHCYSSLPEELERGSQECLERLVASKQLGASNT